MNLTKQVHVYSLDTASFYNESEMFIHRKLLRLYSLRNKIKNKTKSNRQSKKSLYESQHRRINKLLNYFKEKLVEEFDRTREENNKSNKIRQLRPECLVGRNVVSVFESFLTRTLQCKVNEFTEDIMIIQVYFFQIAEDLIKNGFMYKNEKYVLFSASAGQIRTKKFVVIKEDLLKKYQKTLMCGLTIEDINNKGGINVNKFLAYYALNNSATEEWTEFDIDKSIVVDDFESLVTGEVDYINPETYEITRKTMEVPIPHTDGCGMMVEGTTTMVRLPWIKGLMVKFDFRKFAIEHEAHYIKDIYGVQHNILTEDIKYIFTKSQFKMYKYYDSWEQYKECYKKYNCTAGKTNEEEKYIPDAKINYQMLQSLTDTKETEMIKLASKSVNDICSIGYDFRTTMKLLGATEQNINPNSMQKALMIYPELMSDPYNKQILKDVKKSLVKQSKAGKLMIDGKYTFIAPDLYAFCQYLFLGEEKVTGLLENGEVSCNLYPDNKDLDCLRSPHLYREHAVRKNKNNEITKKWFDTKCIYTSCNDLISKLLQFD